MQNPIKDKLAAGQPSIGSWLNLASPLAAEVMAAAGFEWLEGGAGQAQELAAWASGRSDDHRGNGENGYKALEMIHAVYESARLHMQVQMPMKTMANPLDLMIADGHLPIRYPGKYDIRASRLRGENLGSDSHNR